MRRIRAVAAIALAAVLALGATALLPARVEQVAHAVEEVRGRQFERQVPASEIDSSELKRLLRSKILESFPASPEDTARTLVALGFMDETPKLLERLVDFYASQVVAFYDPEPRRFYVVRGAEEALQLQAAGTEDLRGTAERLIFAHELTHALQDETLRLDRRLKELKENGDRALALQCLLEGEATLVMVRVALADLPAADETTEEMLEPLLSAGALERANVPKDIPDYFVEQLFFPYVDGTAYVRKRLKTRGWPEVDRLWKNPPLSTSEILHEAEPFVPAGDLLPDRPERLSPAGFRFLYADTLGEWSLRFLLRRSGGGEEADRAAAGWRGDRIAFFSSGPTIAYLWRLRLETPGAAERFERAWKKARIKRAGWESLFRQGREILIASGLPKVPALPGFPSPGARR